MGTTRIGACAVKSPNSESRADAEVKVLGVYRLQELLRVSLGVGQLLFLWFILEENPFLKDRLDCFCKEMGPPAHSPPYTPHGFDCELPERILRTHNRPL